MATVMVVDDSQFSRIRLIKQLLQQGYQTVEAEDGQDAIDVYQTTFPDVVLMDVTMPRKDGFAALSEILQLDPKAKIIMLTALGQKEMALKALKTGAKGFLVKPCKPDIITRTLQKVLQ